MIGFKASIKTGEDDPMDLEPKISSVDKDLRLSVFQSLISSDIIIDDQFFPFLSQVVEWIKTGKIPNIEDQKKVSTAGHNADS